jgi:hypothetical protein
MRSGNKKLLRYFFIIVLVLSTYHLIRDTLQTFGIHNSFTNILHQPHMWCKPYCNFVTYPLDLLGIIGSLWVLRKNRLWIVGVVILLSMPLWLLAIILP